MKSLYQLIKQESRSCYWMSDKLEKVVYTNNVLAVVETKKLAKLALKPLNKDSASVKLGDRGSSYYDQIIFDDGELASTVDVSHLFEDKSVILAKGNNTATNVYLNLEYHAAIVKEYGQCEVYIRQNNQAVRYVRDGKIVAILMPLNERNLRKLNAPRIMLR